MAPARSRQEATAGTTLFTITNPLWATSSVLDFSSGEASFHGLPRVASIRAVMARLAATSLSKVSPVKSFWSCSLSRADFFVVA